MILLEQMGVYGTEAGSPYIHHRPLQIRSPLDLDSISEIGVPLYARGIQPGDFAVYATVADENMMGYETFLVTQVVKGEGELVSVPLFIESFEQFADVALTRKMQTSPILVESLGLHGIVNQLAKRFPLYLR